MNIVKKAGLAAIVTTIGLALFPGDAQANFCNQFGIVWGNSATCGSGRGYARGEWVLIYSQAYGWQVADQILHVELRGTGTYAYGQGTWDNGTIISGCYAEDNTNNFQEVTDSYGCVQNYAERFNMGAQGY
jgi:hypothetical protein